MAPGRSEHPAEIRAMIEEDPSGCWNDMRNQIYDEDVEKPKAIQMVKKFFGGEITHALADHLASIAMTPSLDLFEGVDFSGGKIYENETVTYIKELEEAGFNADDSDDDKREQIKKILREKGPVWFEKRFDYLQGLSEAGNLTDEQDYFVTELFNESHYLRNLFPHLFDGAGFSGGRITFPAGLTAVDEFNQVFEDLKKAGWNYEADADTQREQIEKILQEKGHFWLGDRYRVMWETTRELEEDGELVNYPLLHTQRNRLATIIQKLPQKDQDELQAGVRIGARLPVEEDEGLEEGEGFLTDHITKGLRGEAGKAAQRELLQRLDAADATGKERNAALAKFWEENPAMKPQMIFTKGLGLAKLREIDWSKIKPLSKISRGGEVDSNPDEQKLDPNGVSYAHVVKPNAQTVILAPETRKQGTIHNYQTPAGLHHLEEYYANLKPGDPGYDFRNDPNSDYAAYKFKKNTGYDSLEEQQAHMQENQDIDTEDRYEQATFNGLLANPKIKADYDKLSGPDRPRGANKISGPDLIEYAKENPIPATVSNDPLGYNSWTNPPSLYDWFVKKYADLIIPSMDEFNATYHGKFGWPAFDADSWAKTPRAVLQNIWQQIQLGQWPDYVTEKNKQAAFKKSYDDQQYWEGFAEGFFKTFGPLEPLLQFVPGGDVIKDGLDAIQTATQPEDDETKKDDKTEEESGEGFLADLTKKVTGKYGGETQTKEFLQKYGTEVITKVVVYLSPLKKLFDQVGDVLTNGALSKAKAKYGYDKLFHLLMVVNGKYRIEKSQTVSMSTQIPTYVTNPDPNKAPISSVNVPVPSGLTIAKMIETTIQKIGDQKFFVYDAFTQNCQIFLWDILQSNGMGSESVRTFIVQDAEGLRKELPKWVPGAASFATDLAGLWNRLRGKGLDEEPDEERREVRNASRVASRLPQDRDEAIEEGEGIEKGALNGYKADLPEEERKRILKMDYRKDGIDRTIKRVLFIANSNEGTAGDIFKKDLKWLEGKKSKKQQK